MKTQKILIYILIATVFSGCATIGHKEFYSQQAPRKYEPTKNVMIFEYSNIALNDVRKLLFDDYLVIGKSSFNGPYEDPSDAKRFAKSLGADILITNSQFKETKTSTIPISTPTTSTTNYSGSYGGSSFYGTSTSYGTQTTMIPITVNRYDQEGFYLKNINKIVPLWESKKDNYKKGHKSIYNGKWANENYNLLIYKSDSKVVAFIDNIKASDERKEAWKKNDLKFIFNNKTKKGIYLMGDKTPIPASFKLNKFGYLEITLLTNNEVFSFEKTKLQ